MASFFHSLLISFVVFLAFGQFSEIFMKLQAILTVEESWISASREASKLLWIEITQLVFLFLFLKFLYFLSIFIKNSVMVIWKVARASILKNILRLKRRCPRLSRSERESIWKIMMYVNKRLEKFSQLQRQDQSIRNIFEEKSNVSGRGISNLTVLDTKIAKGSNGTTVQGSNGTTVQGSNGTTVLESTPLGQPVTVKGLVNAPHEVASKEIQNLIPSDSHPNIVRWYGMDPARDFSYVSLQRYACNLEDLIQAYSDSSSSKVNERYKLRSDEVKARIGDVHLWESNGHPSSQLSFSMRSLVREVVNLHGTRKIHGDLKPKKVLILKETSLCAKLSDFGTGCGSSGWQAPEQLLHRHESRAADMFSLGCVLFFCISGGKHPFGRRKRKFNIEHKKMNLSLLEKFPEAEDVISCLLNNDPELRPQALEVLHHPMFWSSEKKLSFLRDTCERLKSEKRNSDLRKAIKSIADSVENWNQKVDPEFITHIHKHKHGHYKYNSVTDLLRVIRNNLSHYSQLPKNIQELLGSNPDGYYSYFASRFPKLLIEVYKVVSRFCKEEDCWKKYFKSDVV